MLQYHYCWVDWVLGLDRARSILPIPIAVLTEADVTALVKKRKSRAGNRNDQSSDVIESPVSFLNRIVTVCELWELFQLSVVN